MKIFSVRNIVILLNTVIGPITDACVIAHCNSYINWGDSKRHRCRVGRSNYRRRLAPDRHVPYRRCIGCTYG
jgi:hypothetical protein